jgi:hypothetical protein
MRPASSGLIIYSTLRQTSRTGQDFMRTSQDVPRPQGHYLATFASFQMRSKLDM